MKIVVGFFVGVIPFLAGLLAAALLAFVTSVSTSTNVVWESCQPSTIDYRRHGQSTPGQPGNAHYCVRLLDRTYAWGWSRERELAIVDRSDYGFFLTDGLLVGDESGARAVWSAEGVEFTNTRGVRLFVPKERLTSGR